MSSAPEPDAGLSLFDLHQEVEEARLVAVPLPFEATASYRRGTSGAPAAILAASVQVDLFDLELGEPWRAGMAMEAPYRPLAEWNAWAIAAADRLRAGDQPDAKLLAEVNARCAAVERWVAERTADLLAQDKIPALVGGDHSVALGGVLAAAQRFPGLGLLVVDAHADLRAAYQGFTHSHASIIYNLLERADSLGAVVQVGVRDLCREEWELAGATERLTMWTDPELARLACAGEPWSAVVGRVLAPLPRRVWISFDVDGLDPSLCPSTGTPVPGGLSWREASALLVSLARSGRQVVGFDLCEVGAAEYDAAVGARLLYKLAGCALATHIDR